MGLELRKGRDGELINHWFGRYKDKNGKRICKALETPLKGKAPASHLITDKGDTAFEVSRAAAEIELAGYQKQARKKGRSIHLVEDLIEEKTGATVGYARVDDLPKLWRSIDRPDGKPSDAHMKWCDSVFRRFSEAVHCTYLYEVTKEQTTAFLEELREKRTCKTIKDITTLLRSAFNYFMPVGMDNPLSKTIRRKKARTSIDGDMVARRPLTVQQLNVLYETARPDPFLYPLVVCASCTGMRIGDVCRLRWQSVDLPNGWVRVATSKTGVEIEVPMFDRLREVMNVADANRIDSPYVWPEAAEMYLTNLTGITYRGKSLFARAFAATPEKTPKIASKTAAHVNLADVLPQVSEAVQTAEFEESKRDRIMDTLTRYARGESYRAIEEKTGRSRPQISEDLAEAENVSDLHFRKGPAVASKRDLRTLIKNTRQARGKGRLAASVMGWHNLRGTFVVLALDEGIPFETVIKCTGHTTAKTVRDHYYNPTREHTRQAMQRVETRINGKPALPAAKADTLATIAAQLKNMTKADRARLAAMMKT